MGLYERREELTEILCKRRFDTMRNLACEFNVSSATIKRDIAAISRYVPIYTVQGACGGVYVMKEYHRYNKYLNDSQKSELKKAVNGEKYDAEILKSIIDDFSLREKNSKSHRG